MIGSFEFGSSGDLQGTRRSGPSLGHLCTVVGCWGDGVSKLPAAKLGAGEQAMDCAFNFCKRALATWLVWRDGSAFIISFWSLNTKRSKNIENS